MTDLTNNNRQRFLNSFFEALGACEIVWLYQDENCVAGTVVYDPINPDERQDFIWYMEEDKTPSKEVRILLAYLKHFDLLHMDRLKLPAEDITIPTMDARTKHKAFLDLFKVKVHMVEDGEETDFYWIHE